jgi:hypothetical protein
MARGNIIIRNSTLSKDALFIEKVQEIVGFILTRPIRR